MRKNFRLALIVIALAILGAGTFVHAKSDNLDTDKQQKIDAYIEKWRKNFNVPTVQLGILENGKLSYKKTYGNQLSPDKSLVINSMSKAMTAYGIMLLVQNGQLSLDDPVSKYLPGFAISNYSITIRNLLNHSSGLLGDEAEDNSPFDQSYPSVTSEALAIRHFTPDPSQIGTFHYSSVGYIFLGSIIEKVSHMSYGDYMKKNVFEPLGMSQTSAIDDGTIAPGYVSFYGANITFNNTPFNVGGGSVEGIHSTVSDLSKFLVAQAKDSPLQQKYRDMMLDKKALIPYYTGSNASQGLGWVLHNGNGTASDSSYIFHGGTGRGYQSEMGIEPATGFGVVVLTNKIANLSDGILGDGIWIGYLFQGIVDIAHDKEPASVHFNIDPVKNIVQTVTIGILAVALYLAYKMRRPVKHTKLLKGIACILVLAGFATIPLLLFVAGATFISVLKYVPDIMLTAFIVSLELITLGVLLFFYKPKPQKSNIKKKKR